MLKPSLSVCLSVSLLLSCASIEEEKCWAPVVLYSVILLRPRSMAGAKFKQRENFQSLHTPKWKFYYHAMPRRGQYKQRLYNWGQRRRALYNHPLTQSPLKCGGGGEPRDPALHTGKDCLLLLFLKSSPCVILGRIGSEINVWWCKANLKMENNTLSLDRNK